MSTGSFSIRMDVINEIALSVLSTRESSPEAVLLEFITRITSQMKTPMVSGAMWSGVLMITEHCLVRRAEPLRQGEPSPCWGGFSLG